MTHAALKTYWHLAAARRKPSRYAITTSKLLYYPDKGFAIRSPITDWYETYQRGSAIPPERYLRFQDEQQTTYQSYVAQRQEQELVMQHHYATLGTDEHHARLSPAWLAELEGVLPVLRFPYHGLHMVAAYCGQMAPQSELVVAFALQAADELRRVEHLAIRMQQLRDRAPGFGDAARQAWEDDPVWQGVRELIERLLVTYDFGQAWVACNLVVRPVLDQLLLAASAARAADQGDPLTAQILAALADDGRWQRAFTLSLAKQITTEDSALREHLADWIVHWWRAARAAAARALEAWSLPRAEQERLLSELTDARQRDLRAIGIELGDLAAVGGER